MIEVVRLDEFQVAFQKRRTIEADQKTWLPNMFARERANEIGQSAGKRHSGGHDIGIAFVFYNGDEVQVGMLIEATVDV